MISLHMNGFEEHRRHLFGIAYRMLGSAAEAEDMVQEAFLRWQSAEQGAVRSPRAFLSTVVTRLCLDRSKEARAARERYVGPWLPEPIRTEDGEDEDALEAAESISVAFLVLLESLTPLERAVYLLHEVFDYSHAEVAAIVGRDPAACRKLLERARKDVLENRPRFAPSKEAHRRLLEGFADSVVRGDAAALERLLAEDVRSFSDGGGKATAARRPLFGREEVLQLFGNLYRLRPEGSTVEIVDVNGWPAVVARVDGAVLSVIQIETDGETIHTIRATLNPEKLGRI